MPKMPYTNIIYEKNDRLAIITLNRPEKLNALSPELIRELYDALSDADADEAVRVIIITGGDTVFAAGADLGTMDDAAPDVVQAFKLRFSHNNPYDYIEKMGKPVIAAIAGYALGGGCELAMCCDLRIAADTAKFGQPEIRVGLIPGAGGTQRLPRLIGMTKAKELIMIGENIGAEEAKRLGLVNAVVPAESLLDEARKLAAKLIQRPPFGLRLAKTVMNMGADRDLQSALALEREAFAMLFATEDQKEGVRAFNEKRKPDFKGR
jgi:enoyl-CoA hydratase